VPVHMRGVWDVTLLIGIQTRAGCPFTRSASTILASIPTTTRTMTRFYLCNAVKDLLAS
jgi:hypothetical protein